jgi:predicted Zn finger-like uncharacterized protein
MIIACPACATRYVVPDTAIGVEGRTVRCAKCRHSWFQDGPVPQDQAALPEEHDRSAGPAVSAGVHDAPPPAQPGPEEGPAASVSEPAEPASPQPDVHDAPADNAGPEIPALAEDALPPRVYADPDSAGDEDPEASAFDYEPPFRPRRNKTRMWTIAAVIFAVTALAALAAVWRFGLPEWLPMARPTFAEAQSGLQLDFPPNRQDRRRLPNGTEFFGASGTVSNTGQARRSVPTILIVLRDGHDRIVYSAEIAPPKRQLAPGESVTINEAMTDVPKSAKFAEFGWKPG